MNIPAAFVNAYTNSLIASRNGRPHDFMVGSDFILADAVGQEAVLREREFARLHAPKPTPVKESTKRLGCYVDGILRFQSRDHDAVREYADRKMRPITRRLSDGTYRVITANVWVAPVGSFVDEQEYDKMKRSGEYGIES